MTPMVLCEYSETSYRLPPLPHGIVDHITFFFVCQLFGLFNIYRVIYLRAYRMDLEKR